MPNLLAVKPLSLLKMEACEEGAHTLKRSLGPVNLITLGIGAIVGAGIFVLTGHAAAANAGPALALSFVLAGITCAFAGLCYAEFASIIPIAGSAYTYGYATLGEFVAWIIGWDLVLEYAFGAATVASGWSGYLLSLLAQLGYAPSPAVARFCYNYGASVYLTQNQQGQDHWQLAGSFMPGSSLAGMPHVTGVFNLIAFLIIAIVTTILVIGIKESANLNSVIVIVKLLIVGVFIVLGVNFLIHHPHIAYANWHPFIPPNEGPGRYGLSGIAAGAASVFFAYIGFDAVSTAAQEAKNPSRDMPIGILGSLVFCTLLYIIVSLVLTGMVNYRTLNVAEPVAVGIDATGVAWGGILVKVGAVFGLFTVMLVMLLGQSRVFFSMSKDGLLPKWASSIHPKFRTPWISSIVVGTVVAFLPALLDVDRLSQLVNMGTLLAFSIVSAGVWILRVRQPDLPRPFKTPFVPAVPILGILSAFYLMFNLPLLTWEVVIVWLIVGLVIYFSYSQKHSLVQKLPKHETAGR
jgi:APA family basic amino acid/polyamine antiporter